jgi:exonuclease III
MSNWQSEGTIFGLPGAPVFRTTVGQYREAVELRQTLLESGAPAVLAGDFNVMPTDLDVYAGTLGR